jgi:hypothetical protein
MVRFNLAISGTDDILNVLDKIHAMKTLSAITVDYNKRRKHQKSRIIPL